MEEPPKHNDEQSHSGERKVDAIPTPDKDWGRARHVLGFRAAHAHRLACWVGDFA
jgi:hypothetical protein